MFHGYAAHGAGKKLEPFDFEPAGLGPNDVEIAITHCGICHSDIHLANNDWGISAYPLVPGHEVVGEVATTGSAVNSLKPGDRVGVGWLSATCNQCESCREGHENTCASWQPTCVGRPGGFADRIRVDHRWAFGLPKGVASDEAGPLMCGGATMYTPLADHGVKDGARVGVVSVGGLGHLGIQFARARGCKVTAFSTSPEKEAECREMGAEDFVLLTDEDAINGHMATQDFLLTTTPTDLPWDAMLGLLRPRGTLCLIGVPSTEVKFQAFPVIGGHKRIVGSNTGSRKGIRAMLETAAKEGVRPMIERHAMSDVNAAMERVAKNQVRYRAVLVA